MMPGLVPPKFEISGHENNEFTLNYTSEREGLGEHFNADVEIELLDNGDNTQTSSFFHVKYA